MIYTPLPGLTLHPKGLHGAPATKNTKKHTEETFENAQWRKVSQRITRGPQPPRIPKYSQPSWPLSTAPSYITHYKENNIQNINIFGEIVKL